MEECVNTISASTPPDEIRSSPALPKVNWLRRSLLSLLVLSVVLALTGVANQFIATRTDERNFLPQGQLTTVGNFILHIHCEGTGTPTIVLESGLGGTSLDWSLVQPSLATTTRVCSYDRAGLGWSAVNPSRALRTSEQIAGELHMLLRNSGIPGPYILAGFAAGGMHTQMYASQYSDEVVGLVLVDPTPAELMTGFSPEKRHELLPNLAQFRLRQRLEPFGLLRILPLPGSEALLKLPAETRDAIRAVNLKSGAADALYQEAAGFETSVLQTAAREPLPVQLPITVIWHGDPAEPVELEALAEASVRELADGSEYGRFIIAENSEQSITFDRPDLVIEALSTMVNDVRVRLQIR